jgi:hypothetical protein
MDVNGNARILCNTDANVNDDRPILLPNANNTLVPPVDADTAALIAAVAMQ